MKSSEIRSKFLKFFKERGHKIVPSASLVPENDPSVLFTTAGMQQFKSYYTNSEGAERDFGSRNVVTVQKCIRTGDIDEVGDANHLTFFEMMGNFSFGGYGRHEAIIYAYDFITKELKLEISYVSLYKGEGIVPKDEESEKIWIKLGVKDIREDGSDVFWGPTGDSGPCGPTTEIYCKNADGQDVEIWNIVFNEYFCDGSRKKLDNGEAKLTKLPILGIDTGMGFERLVSIVQNKKSVYETDLFDNEKTKEERIITDHIKAALFIISDGMKPSNKGSGYVLRRLMRTVASYKKIDVENLIEILVNKFKKLYPELSGEKFILEFNKEKDGYNQAYRTAETVLKKHQGKPLTGHEAFGISSTLGVRVSDIIKITEKIDVETEDKFNEKFEEASKKHQELSRTSSAGMFKGGLANHNEKTIKLHTAHHLLLAGLQSVVDPNIKQKGSNINEERLRIDFLCDHKLTDEEKKKVEEWVNDKIQAELNIAHKEMSFMEAEKIGAEMEFGAKYPDAVSVYFIEDKDGNSVSKEFCGGPHVKNTKELDTFKILKEEATSAGVRRIKATLL